MKFPVKLDLNTRVEIHTGEKLHKWAQMKQIIDTEVKFVSIVVTGGRVNFCQLCKFCLHLRTSLTLI